MRIAIIGAQCTGKSTLANALSEQLNIPLITEIVRNYKKEQLQCTNPEYPQIQKEILRLQREEEKKYEDFVSDRSTIDNMSYWIYGCVDKVSVLENIDYIHKSLSNSRTYTYIFYLKPEILIVDDGFRECNLLYQRDIDTIIHTILKLFNLKYNILSGSVKERTKQAMEILKQ